MKEDEKDGRDKESGLVGEGLTFKIKVDAPSMADDAERERVIGYMRDELSKGGALAREIKEAVESCRFT